MNHVMQVYYGQRLAKYQNSFSNHVKPLKKRTETR